ncbi:hypothetical protein [Alistipes indistinctus]|uniref:hypothetical protein n=1 Tax=Alistipes indistinctus TaxID=626932 RepID=UPI003AB3BCAB
MGQYYHAVVLPPQSKKLTIAGAFIPGDYKMWCKLMEHSWAENDFVRTVERHFSPGERFYKHRLVWAGDYADHEPGHDTDLYDLCENKSIKSKIDPVGDEFKYLVNHTRKVYVDKTAMPKDSDGWQVHPLPLLTCEGNGRGGGDYFHDDPEVMLHVGSWARDIISVETEFPADYTELQVKFEPR